ncbi:MAG: ABC transporter permease [Desulfovibrio sp.]|jgi:nitrate/nitrite transport system permease protein|nr:ABC transporter permease [Desulfovibrio sp.]
MTVKSALLSVIIGGILLLFWMFIADTSEIPSPSAVGATAFEFLSDPFYDAGPNDKGIGILTAYTMLRLLSGFTAASVCAVFFGVMLGRSATLFTAVNPYIQVLRAISPIAWMPLLLYTVKDSGVTAFLVVFMASIWPTLANTAFGVANIRKDYLNVAAILQMNYRRKLFQVILPAAGPTIVAGLKISMGSAWVSIIPAEAMLGSMGLGYFVWNEWNNLSLTSVIFAILTIGAVGVVIDALFTRISRRLSYAD